MHHDDAVAPSALRTWLSTLPALAVLLLVVAQGTSEMIQARLMAVGEEVWPGYAEVRYDPPEPDCDVATIGQADDGPRSADDALLDDLFDDGPGEAAADEAAPDEAPAPAAEGGDDALLDDLFGDDAGPSDAAIAAAKARCEGEHTRHAELLGMITPALKVFRGVDTTLAVVTDWGRRLAKPSLILLIALCAATASALRAHIALRPVKTAADEKVSEGAQIVANLLAMTSCLFRYQIVSASGVDTELPELALVWAAGFGAMAALSARHLFTPSPELTPGGSWAKALLTVPLYAIMALVASAWFLGAENHPSGLAIYLDKLTEQAGLYLQVGLFVWAGMLLKRTRLAHLSFDLLRPWKLAPELMVAVVVVASALPTAYSGASGIFVIAAGAIIYEELRASGARNQLALAATAMSGSLGVVLSPCLLVVIVASLNKQVTTTELFNAGYGVFALTAVLFVGVLLLSRRNPLTMAPVGEAMAGMLTAARAMVPYAVVLVVTVLAYGLVLDAWMDEHSASRILLVILLLFLVWEGVRPHDRLPIGQRLAGATTETTVHIGALLALMGLSVGFGGIVERSEVMAMVPADLGGPVPTMMLLTGMLVIIGMLMDPYGAVILVSATIAHVAYDNGVEPLHFWMVVLVAFELGYLTPPVALNHLLTRLVVGDAADEDDLPEGAGFWARHEHILLPVAVMGTALVLVAFVPLAF
ncbi:MAG: TRAP transporter large permease subunit [Alphaproteobacteria bacterium]|nr:TRAP transporter large permease subunit [Alphaproteobacteria bacterium]